jgi:hypothetical protein
VLGGLHALSAVPPQVVVVDEISAVAEELAAARG